MPALAVLDAVREIEPKGLEVRFFGPSNRGEREIVEARGLRFVTVPAAGLRGKGPVAIMRGLATLGWGVLVGMWRIGGFRPDVVFSTGGYASFPCSVAARLLRRPLVIYLPDVEPGWAVRAEKRLATRIATTTERGKRALPAEKTTVTGYPVRAEFFELTRGEARARLVIEEGEKVLLVAGASQGARAINRAIFTNLRELCEAARVFHITGAADLAEALRLKATLEPELSSRYAPAAYREDMPAVMTVADLAIARAGASVLGELPAASLPAILVPGTFAGGHQRDNAAWLRDTGAAEVIEEGQIHTLAEQARTLLTDTARLDQMQAAAAVLARPSAAADIARLVLEVAGR